MRHVFPTAEIPHKWARQTQNDARNPQGNLSFSGDTIRSYSTDAAKIYRHKARGTLVLIDEHRYSNTTAGQLSLIRRAVSHLTAIEVPYPCIGKYGADNHTAAGAHALNVKYLVALAAKHLAKAQRAVMARNVGWRRAAAREALQSAGTYSLFFGIRRKVPAFPAEAWNAAAARAERIENPDPVRDAKRFKLREQRAAATDAVTEYRQEMMRSMQAAGHYLGYRVHVGKRWPAMLARKVGEKGTPWYHDMARRTAWRIGESAHPDRDGAVMLRVNGEEIETSQGARIPLAAAPLVWAKVQRALGKGWKPSGLCAMKIGDYALDGIDADGTLRAGCHVIPHSELRSMARQLNLT